MILSDEQLKKVGAANQGRYMQSLVTNLMDTIADLRRQLAESEEAFTIAKKQMALALKARVDAEAKVDGAVLAESEWWAKQKGYHHSPNCAFDLLDPSPNADFCTCDAKERRQERDKRLAANRAKVKPTPPAENSQK